MDKDDLTSLESETYLWGSLPKLMSDGSRSTFRYCPYVCHFDSCWQPNVHFNSDVTYYCLLIDLFCGVNIECLDLWPTSLSVHLGWKLPHSYLRQPRMQVSSWLQCSNLMFLSSNYQSSEQKLRCISVALVCGRPGLNWGFHSDYSTSENDDLAHRLQLQLRQNLECQDCCY